MIRNRSSPQDEATSDLIAELRESVIPQAVAGTGLQAFVGGQTAAFEDIRVTIASRMPLFFTLVIGLSFVLLMVVFRSIAVPLKAAVMNLIAIGAAYGVLVAIFQWGWFAGPLGVGREGPIEAFVPMMLFAILFGLSMDYEAFLLSRVRENCIAGDGNSEAAGPPARRLLLRSAAAQSSGPVALLALPRSSRPWRGLAGEAGRSIAVGSWCLLERRE